MKLAKLLILTLVLAASAAVSAETRDPEDHFFNLNSGDFKAEAVDAKSAGKKAILSFFHFRSLSGLSPTNSWGS